MHEGLAQVYRKLQEKGYTRCYDSMTRQIKKLKLKTIQEKKENRKKKKEERKESKQSNKTRRASTSRYKICTIRMYRI